MTARKPADLPLAPVLGGIIVSLASDLALASMDARTTVYLESAGSEIATAREYLDRIEQIVAAETARRTGKESA